MEQRSLLYDERLLESYARSVITYSSTAMVELITSVKPWHQKMGDSLDRAASQKELKAGHED